MKALFMVFHGFAAHNGISKKIFYQVEALRRCGVDTRLCYLGIDREGYQKRMAGERVLENYGNGIGAKIRKRVSYGAVTRYLQEEGIGLVYLRCDHNANPFLTHWLKQVKKLGIKVVMEIPTYPYDPEYSQSRLSRRLRLRQDKLFRRAMARQIDRIVTFTDCETIFGVPTIRISNGIDFGQIPLRKAEPAPGRLRLIGVADIHFWHGFDRAIAGLAAYAKQPHETRVTFDIVGEGVPAELERLRGMVRANGLEGQVIFHGAKASGELDRLFDSADFGIASLARHRCGIDRIKTLKNREYAARGIPFVYSETDDDFDTMPYILKAPADETPLDIAAIDRFRQDLSLSPGQIRSSVEETLSWQVQMRKVLDETPK